MKNDYILIVLVLITVGISLLLWKYPQKGGGSEDGQFYFSPWDPPGAVMGAPSNPNAHAPSTIPGDIFGGWVPPSNPLNSVPSNWSEIEQAYAAAHPPRPPSGPYNPAVSYYDVQTGSVKPISDIVKLGITAQTTAQQYATAATNYQKMLQQLPNTDANQQKIKAAQKAKDAAYAKAQSVRKDFYKKRDNLSASQKQQLAKTLSKPPPKPKTK